jgi:endonuclease-3
MRFLAPERPSMQLEEKARLIADRLAEMYPDPPIPLDHHDAFSLLVAVLLSAQCTDKRVNEVTPLLFAQAPDAAAMAAMDVAAIEAIIRPCGLSNNKSKAIQRLAQLLLERHGGVVPSDFAALEALPGVGHKTASVVMTQAFGVPSFPVDTHIHRLAWRWGLSEGKTVEQTEADLKRIFPKVEWALLHLRIIYFGREYCKARGHDPQACPLCALIGRPGLEKS